MDSSNYARQDHLTEAVESLTESIVTPDEPLSLSRKAEIWSGRFAMIGFMTTVMAIVFKSTI